MGSKKKVLVLFGKSSWGEDAPFQKKPQYRFCYEKLYSMAEAENLEIYRASYEWFDWDAGEFSNAWSFSKGEWTRVHGVIPDIIYDKTKHHASSQLAREKLSNRFKIFNDPDFTLLLSNKLYTSLLFPEFMKRNMLVRSKDDLAEVISKIETDKIVFKPASGSGGDGVVIMEKEDIYSSEIKYPIIAQEFIDSSNGIKGLTQETHDLRVVIVNEKVVYAYIRTPKKGSLLANLAQGGTMKIVPLEKIPSSVLDIIDIVKEKLRVFGDSIYTIDLMFDEKNVPWVIELNTMPGMYFAPGQEEWMERMYSQLITVFKKI